MKSFFIKKLCWLFAISVILVACNSDFDESVNSSSSVEPELSNFFTSNEYEEIANSLNIKTSNFTLDKRVVKHVKNNVSYYCIPIHKNGSLAGQAIVFSQNNGKAYRVLYEDRTNFSEEKGGIIRIFTGNNRFVASLECTVATQGKILMKIDEVAPIRSQMKSRTEWPTPDDGWFDCTARCFKIAQDVCEDDDKCNFLCEIANLAKGCTISIAAACGIYCI